MPAQPTASWSQARAHSELSVSRVPGCATLNERPPAPGGGLSSERQKVGLTAAVRPRESVCRRRRPRDASGRPRWRGCRWPALSSALAFQENSPWKSSSEGPRATRPSCVSCSATPAAPASSEPGAHQLRSCLCSLGIFFFFFLAKQY